MSTQGTIEAHGSSGPNFAVSNVWAGKRERGRTLLPPLGNSLGVGEQQPAVGIKQVAVQGGAGSHRRIAQLVRIQELHSR